MLNDRSTDILLAIVESYIDSCEPVASNYILKKYGFNQSPATIRNIMAKLENMGYLHQPHTSAGRIPTDKGYRYYVNHLKTSIRSRYNLGNQLLKRLYPLQSDINILLKETARTLSRQANCLGIAVSVKPSQSTLNRIQLFRYKRTHVAAVIFTNEGLIQHRIVDFEDEITQKDLNRISEYINSEYSGSTIDEIHASIARKLSKERALCDIMISRVTELCEDAVDFEPSDIFVSGMAEFFGIPELSDKIINVVRAIEDKQIMLRLLEKASARPEVSVIIGSENPIPDLKGLSIVTASYMQDDRPLGAVGVIGPTRMDYSNIMTIVGATANFITRAISDERRVNWRKKGK